jgi:Carboxypeptidase regulatory-like domain
LRRYIFISLLFLTCHQVAGQELNQSVRGTVAEVTANVIAGVAVELQQAGKAVASAVTDATGKFSLSVEPGRYLIVFSHVGFQTRAEELLVISGKESQLNIVLTERVTQLEEVSITAMPSVNAAPGGTDIAIEKTLRVPANFFDPLRMASSMPGMAAVNDQGNALAVKGYSPNSILWKLEGLDIVNPNHLANAGTLSDKPVSFGGGVSILSSQVLDKTGFYSGWLPAQYGNALSAVVDMGLRNGNREKMEYTAQASLIGLDVAAEGPLGGSKKSSFLANYRYSTVGLLSQLGVNFGDESINFQDLTFHIDVEQNKQAHLSVFGFGGLSTNRFKRKLATEWKTEKDRYDIDFDGQVFGLGFKEKWGQKVKWTWGTVLSGQSQDRTSKSDNVPFQHVNSEKYFNDHLLLSNQLQAKVKVGSHSFESGVLVNYLNNQLEVETITPFYINSYFPNISGSVKGLLWQPYFNWTKKWTAPWQLDAGVRYTYFAYNQTASADPRLSVSRLLPSGSLSLSYGRVSQWQQVQTYLAQTNKNLGLNKADQYLAEYRQHFGYRAKLVVSAYYHQLTNIPISPTLPYYSALNQWEDFPTSDLVSTGTGQNTGAEVSFDKSFYNQFYFTVNGSYYKSTYKGFGTDALPTRFNGGFTTSLLAGKEWGSSDRSFGVHFRFLYLGGMRHPVIDLFNSTTYGTTVYDVSQGYSVKLPDYWRPDLRVSWRKNKAGYTRTLSIDIQNLANHLNVAYYYYDTFTRDVEVKYQLGIIPVLVYRVDF